MSKRVWQIAKSLGAPSREVMKFANSVGVQVKSPSSKIEPICASVIESQFWTGRKYWFVEEWIGNRVVWAWLYESRGEALFKAAGQWGVGKTSTILVRNPEGRRFPSLNSLLRYEEAKS